MQAEHSSVPDDDRWLLFVSYSCRDATHPFLEQIRRLCERPDMKAIARLFMAEDRPEFGADFIEKVLTALDGAGAALPFITEESQNSAWVNQEVGYALARGIPVLPAFDPRTVKYLQGMIQTVDACPVNDEAKVSALFARLRELATRPRPTRRPELMLEFKGVWWSWIRGALPMYVRFGLTHESHEPDSVKQAVLECADQTIQTEDTGKLTRLDAADFKEVTLKFFPLFSAPGGEPLRLIITTVRGKRAETQFNAAPGGWRPPNAWKDFVPY